MGWPWPPGVVVAAVEDEPIRLLTTMVITGKEILVKVGFFCLLCVFEEDWITLQREEGGLNR